MTPLGMIIDSTYFRRHKCGGTTTKPLCVCFLRLHEVLPLVMPIVLLEMSCYSVCIYFGYAI